MVQAQSAEPQACGDLCWATNGSTSRTSEGYPSASDQAGYLYLYLVLPAGSQAFAESSPEEVSEHFFPPPSTFLQGLPNCSGASLSVKPPPGPTLSPL